MLWRTLLSLKMEAAWSSETWVVMYSHNLEDLNFSTLCLVTK